jgi:hypothetical protein
MLLVVMRLCLTGFGRDSLWHPCFGEERLLVTMGLRHLYSDGYSLRGSGLDPDNLLVVTTGALLSSK